MDFPKLEKLFYLNYLKKIKILWFFSFINFHSKKISISQFFMMIAISNSFKVCIYFILEFYIILSIICNNHFFYIFFYLLQIFPNLKNL